MNDEAALLAAIRADPGADTPRLVYADWLDDHGDTARAEFIRLQVSRARAKRRVKAAESIDREIVLARKHWRTWLPGEVTFLKRPGATVISGGKRRVAVVFKPGDGDPHAGIAFVRGFAEHVVCPSWSWWYRCRLTSTHPIREVIDMVGFLGIDPESDEELAKRWPGVVFNFRRSGR